MWRTIALTILGSLTACLAAPAVAADGEAPACQAALDLILGAVGHGKRAVALVVGSSPDAAETAPYSAETMAEADWTGPAPPAELLNTLLTQTPVSVFDSCPNLAAELGREHIASGDDAVARITAADPGIDTLPTYPATIFTLSLPVIQGGDALVQDRMCTGPNSCLGAIVHLQKDAKSGRWKPVNRLLSLAS
ncbi:MAG TPA: hypothetical protein VIC25_07595 [Caulobacteraceae bacterium]|jgi:hypothetical protein